MPEIASEHYEDVDVVVDGGVAWVELRRPPVNALRTRTYEELLETFGKLGDDREALVIVLHSGSPRAFCAGADVKELPMPPDEDERRQRLARRLFELVRHSPQVVIAELNGPALGGGCALAAATDIRVASGAATLGLPEITVGRCGGSRHLMRIMPQGAVRLGYFTGQPFSAEEAFRLGAVDVLVSAEELRPTVQRLARDIAAKSPVALRMAKEALNLAEELPIERGYQVEQQFTLRLALRDEQK